MARRRRYYGRPRRRRRPRTTVSKVKSELRKPLKHPIATAFWLSSGLIVGGLVPAFADAVIGAYDKLNDAIGGKLPTI